MLGGLCILKVKVGRELIDRYVFFFPSDTSSSAADAVAILDGWPDETEMLVTVAGLETSSGT